MKIQSNIYKNTTVKLGSERVTFDSQGIAEISEETFLKYNGLGTIFEYGKMPKTEVEEVKDFSPEIEELKFKVARLQGIIDSKNVEIAELKEAESIWRQKVMDMLEEKEGSVESAKKAISEVETKEADLSALRDQLNQMHHKQLPKFLKESLELDEAEFSGLKTKEELIEFAINKLK